MALVTLDNANLADNLFPLQSGLLGKDRKTGSLPTTVDTFAIATNHFCDSHEIGLLMSSIIYRHATYDHNPAQFEGPDGEGRIQVMSTFSGIGAASVSWNPNFYEFVAYAEPEAFPAHVVNGGAKSGHTAA